MKKTLGIIIGSQTGSGYILCWYIYNLKDDDVAQFIDTIEEWKKEEGSEDLRIKTSDGNQITVPAIFKPTVIAYSKNELHQESPKRMLH